MCPIEVLIQIPGRRDRACHVGSNARVVKDPQTGVSIYYAGDDSGGVSVYNADGSFAGSNRLLAPGQIGIVAANKKYFAPIELGEPTTVVSHQVIVRRT